MYHFSSYISHIIDEIIILLKLHENILENIKWHRIYFVHVHNNVVKGYKFTFYI